MKRVYRRQGQNCGFTAGEKDRMVRAYVGGLPPPRLAERFGCSTSTIKDILEAAGVYVSPRKSRKGMEATNVDNSPV